MSKFEGEFAAHPSANELYVVNGMPFLVENDANNFARGSDHKVVSVKRGTTSATNTNSDVSGMSKVDIANQLEYAGIEFDSKAKKADLVVILKAHVASLVEG